MVERIEKTKHLEQNRTSKVNYCYYIDDFTVQNNKLIIDLPLD